MAARDKNLCPAAVAASEARRALAQKLIRAAGRPIRMWPAILRQGLTVAGVSLASGLCRNQLLAVVKGRRGCRREVPDLVFRTLLALGADLGRFFVRRPADLMLPCTAAEAEWCRWRSTQLRESGGADAVRIPAFEIVGRAELWRAEKKRRARKMLSQEVLRHFGLARDPFAEPEGREDVFVSRPQRALEALVLETARRRGMLAILGDVGSGKTTAARRAIQLLAGSSNYAVAYVRALNRERVDARAIQIAMLMTFEGADARIPNSGERLTRRVVETVHALLDRNVTPVLVIDEAQALDVHALRPLKRIREETGLGYKSGCAVVLIGQTGTQPDLRQRLALPMVKEVAVRLQIYEMPALDGDLADYVAWRFGRAGCRRSPIEAKALAALARHFKGNVTPQLVENVLTTALGRAWAAGQKSVTGEVIHDCLGTLAELEAAGEGEEGGGEGGAANR